MENEYLEIPEPSPGPQEETEETEETESQCKIVQCNYVEKNTLTFQNILYILIL